MLHKYQDLTGTVIWIVGHAIIIFINEELTYKHFRKRLLFAEDVTLGRVFQSEEVLFTARFVIESQQIIVARLIALG